MGLISVGQGVGGEQGTERSGNEERSSTWRRVRPHKGILWHGYGQNCWHQIFTGPPGSTRAEKSLHSQSPSANWHSCWLSNSWENLLWFHLECFISIFINGMGKKLLKARAWLIMEAEVLFGGSIWKSTPPSMCWKAGWSAAPRQGEARHSDVFPEMGLMGRSAPSSSKCFWPEDAHYPVLSGPPNDNSG